MSDNIDDGDELLEDDRTEPGPRLRLVADEEADTYQVGYRKPPKHGQFKPGQSGNPRGRKKGSRGLKTDLNVELNRAVDVTFGKYSFSGTTQQLALRTLALLAANGNLKAIGQFTPLILSVFGTEDRGGDKRTLSPQDQAIFDNFFTAFGGELKVSDENEKEEPEAEADGDGAGDNPPPSPAAAADDDPDDCGPDKNPAGNEQ